MLGQIKGPLLLVTVCFKPYTLLYTLTKDSMCSHVYSTGILSR